MKLKSEMSWTCPDCQSRNETLIASDAEAGKVVDVSCHGCETQHQASILFALTEAGAPMTVGVVWV